MKFLKALILLTIFCSCKNRQEQETKLDIWNNIQKAIEVKDTFYLIKISADTVSCLGCNNGKDWTTKHDFFKNHIEQIDMVKNKTYTFQVEDLNNNDNFKKRYRINYKFKNHNLIYTILKGENKIEFRGVFSVP